MGVEESACTNKRRKIGLSHRTPMVSVFWTFHGFPGTIIPAEQGVLKARMDVLSCGLYDPLSFQPFPAFLPCPY
jgi:hypothetical protein